MPRSGNGIGTVFYGRSSEMDDGSYITTTWFAILYLPIIPIRSERILPLSQYDNGGGRSHMRYSIIARCPLDWPEIKKTYAVGWGILAWYGLHIFFYGSLSRFFGADNMYWVAFAWLLLPFGVLFAWQKWFRPPPKFVAVKVTPGSEFSVFQKNKSRNDPKR